MGFFDFGKRKLRSNSRRTRKTSALKRRLTRRSVKKARKPPAALLRRCRKYRIKTTVRKGGKRVYRKASLLKKLLRQKVKKVKKTKKTRKTHRKSRRCWSFGRKRRSGFGSTLQGYAFENPTDYGYNQTPKQYTQTLSQSNSVVDDKTNMYRPADLQLSSSDLPIYGVCRDFFGQCVPTQVSANYNFMGQPDGSLFPVSGNVSTEQTPIAFGRRRSRRFGGGGCGSPFLKRDATGKCVFKSAGAIVGKTLQKAAKGGAYVVGGAANSVQTLYNRNKNVRRRSRRFGGGGCGSPFLKRDATGKCVFKSAGAIVGKSLQKAAKGGAYVVKGASNSVQTLYNRNKNVRRRSRR